MTVEEEVKGKAKRKPNVYTEAEMLTMLRARHTEAKRGNGDGWAFLTHVRNEASWDATRTIDALAMGLWKSRGYDLHAFEVKCSRADYLTEIRDGAKAEEFAARVDHFWMVVADASIVKDDLPHGWGLLVATPPRIDEETGIKVLGTLRQVKAAPRQHLSEKDRLITRSWLVCLLKAAGASRPDATPQEVEEAHRKAWDDSRKHYEQMSASSAQHVETLRAQLQQEREVRRVFEMHSGISLDDYRGLDLGRAEVTGNLVRAALRGDDSLRQTLARMERVETDLRGLADGVKYAREQHHGSAVPLSAEARALGAT